MRGGFESRILTERIALERVSEEVEGTSGTVPTRSWR
jgi:hypothetical protein